MDTKKLPPIIIMIAVAIGLVGGVIGIVESFELMSTDQAAGYVLLAISIFEIVLMLGLWFMKKWALIVYTVIFVVDIFTGSISLSIILPIAVILVSWMNFKQFS